MIKVNDNYEIERDKYQWFLHEIGEKIASSGKNEGMPIQTRRTTYHASFTQVANEIIERQMGRCTSLEEISELLGDCQRFLVQRMEECSE